MCIEDIQVGDKITVLKWLHRRDCSYVGEVLTVKAIYAPFVAIELGQRVHRYVTNLDSRECSFAKLSPEYVAALEPESEWPNEIVTETPAE